MGPPHESQFLSEELVPAWALHGLQFFQAISACSNLVLSTGCREIPAFTVVSSIRVQEIPALTVVSSRPSMGCRGISSPGKSMLWRWGTSFPLFFPDLGVHRTVSHTFCSFILCLHDIFFPFLKYILPEVVPLWQKGTLCPAADLLEPSGAGCASPSHPCSTVSPPTLPCELKTCRQIAFAKIQLNLNITLRTRREMVLLLPFHVVWVLYFGS